MMTQTFFIIIIIIFNSDVADTQTAVFHTAQS